MRNFTPILIVVLIGIVIVSAALVLYLKRQPPSESKSSPVLNAVEENSNYSAGPLEEDNFSDATISGTPVPSKAPLSDYTYPGSEVVNVSSSTLKIQSSDDAQVITNWYKDKIEQLGFNAKSLTKTSTNGVVLNNISAAKPGEKITISIKKDQNESNVLITVDRS